MSTKLNLNQTTTVLQVCLQVTMNNNHIQQHTQSTSHNETSGRISGNYYSETVKDNDDTNLNNNKTSATGITHQEVKNKHPILIKPTRVTSR